MKRPTVASDQRHYNPEQNTELAAAINLGRFNQRIRKSHDVTLHDQKVVYAEQQRKEQCKVAVPQIQGLCHQYVVRNKTAGKQSGKVESIFDI